MNYIWIMIIVTLAAIVIAYQLVDCQDQVKPDATPVPPAGLASAIEAAVTEPPVSNKIPQEDNNVPIPSVVRQSRAANRHSGALSASAPSGGEAAPVHQPLASLDELVKIAYHAKEEQNAALAFNTFLQALKLYPESIAAPYFVIEIGNLLKAQGAYDAAINLFSEGRNLPAMLQNSMLDQEFVHNIAYLRIAKNVLLERTIGSIPLHQIPADVLAEINHEFAEWSVME
ncbi:tetratricopeptide repeat protein [Acetonema longum]|uniref:Tetratricopeptide repeat protein n=1 Tax=Acetonema longum DSM 6540 TaxID=1009370 RepID=F7NJP0_9FIRM|nr:hypothetical protein [Acetonema longum]EGO63744.1 hypothetical protein ALO_11489 [Acetonema longum DSM 6540]